MLAKTTRQFPSCGFNVVKNNTYIWTSYNTNYVQILIKKDELCLKKGWKSKGHFMKKIFFIMPINVFELC